MKRYTKRTAIMPWFICSLGALFFAYEYLLRISPSVMTSELQHFFKINRAQLGNLSAFYYYIYAPMQLCVGVLMDRYGPRRLLTMATFCCVAGSFFFAATNIFAVAAASRVLMGFGSAFAFVGVLKLATIWLPRRYFAIFSGVATALGMLGAIIGELVLTRMVELFGWQHTIYAAGSCGIAIALLIGIFVRDENMERKSHHIPHVETLDSAVAALIRIMKKPQMWVTGIIGCLLYVPISAFAELWGIPYLKQAHQFSPEEAAFAVTMIFWGWVFGGPTLGWVSEKLHNRRYLMTIMTLIALIFIYTLLYTPKLSLFYTCSLLFCFGVCTSVQILVFVIGRELNPLQFSATACAFINMVVMMAGDIFQPLMGFIMDQVAGHSHAHTSHAILNAAAYQKALSIMPITLIISAFLSHFILKETGNLPTSTIDSGDGNISNQTVDSEEANITNQKSVYEQANILSSGHLI